MRRLLSFAKKLMRRIREAHSPYHRTKALLGSVILCLFIGCQSQVEESEPTPAPPALPHEDIIVQGIVPASSLTSNHRLTAHRLIFKKGSILQTNGTDLRIDANEIQSDGGIVQTFAYNQVSAKGVNGRAGGRIEIRARSGSGSLFVIARGENGGPGIPGRSGERGKNGGPGTEGKCGFRGTHIHCENIEKYVFEIWKERAKTDPGTAEVVSSFYCRVPPSNGAPGQEGGRGGDGGNGGNGGASGDINVRIDVPDSFEVRTDLLPGSGGNGATWGDGGDGGDGGEAGSPDDLGVCPPAQRGMKGARGPIGSWGINGLPGKRGHVCVQMGQRRLRSCDELEQ